MQPQRILPDSELEHSHVSSRVTFYGGRVENELGNFACGHIQASIMEHIPERVRHQAGRYQSPIPFIPRLLDFKNGVITVDTPTVHAPIDEGPVVIEGMRGMGTPRFRKTTIYNSKIGAVTVKSGELITDGHGWKDDKTVELDAGEIPEDILLPRLATVMRTIKATSRIFEQIASRNVSDVQWTITEDNPF